MVYHSQIFVISTDQTITDKLNKIKISRVPISKKQTLNTFIDIEGKSVYVVDSVLTSCLENKVSYFYDPEKNKLYISVPNKSTINTWIALDVEIDLTFSLRKYTSTIEISTNVLSPSKKDTVLYATKLVPYIPDNYINSLFSKDGNLVNTLDYQSGILYL